MDLKDFFPIWSRLKEEERALLSRHAMPKTLKKGTVLQSDDTSCLGLLLVRSGQLRAYICSEEGKEITLYRLSPPELCLFSASCMMRSMQFELFLSAERDTECLVIPAEVYRSLSERSAVIANYTSEIMASRFTDVMWLMEQVLWKSFDRRLAAFLTEEAEYEGGLSLRITHEQIASHLGTAREVVTRMLKYFSSEGLVSLNRGTIELLDPEALARLGR